MRKELKHLKSFESFTYVDVNEEWKFFKNDTEKIDIIIDELKSNPSKGLDKLRDIYDSFLAKGGGDTDDLNAKNGANQSAKKYYPMSFGALTGGSLPGKVPAEEVAGLYLKAISPKNVEKVDGEWKNLGDKPSATGGHISTLGGY
jgi:hypothetical protein